MPKYTIKNYKISQGCLMKNKKDCCNELIYYLSKMLLRFFKNLVANLFACGMFCTTHRKHIAWKVCMTSPVLIIVGTRPEGIKMIPVYFALKKAHVAVVICSTNQHSTLLDEVFQLFEVIPDYQLDLMKPAQDLFHITAEGLYKIKNILLKVNPLLVLVQGDTTSSMSAALAAFYLKIPVGHVEAGLRTGDINNPFPEELNRQCISLIAKYHFAPTRSAVNNLLAESKAKENIFCTGNTVVDALQCIQTKIAQGVMTPDSALHDKVQAAHTHNKKIILLTTHRRESFNGGTLSILKAVRDFALAHNDVVIFYPFHPNPAVLEAIGVSEIAATSNVHLLNPLLYKDLIYLLSQSYFVATDSGGIQEEAISLGKQVIVLRDKTERSEGIAEGLAVLAGTSYSSVRDCLEKFLRLGDCDKHMPSSVYGTGNASYLIANIINQQRPFLSLEPMLYKSL